MLETLLTQSITPQTSLKKNSGKKIRLARDYKDDHISI